MEARFDLRQAARLAAVVIVAGAAAVITTLGLAGLEHEVLIRTIGQEGIAGIDGTLSDLAMVAADYGLGLVVGLSALVLGYRRYVRRRARDIQ